MRLKRPMTQDKPSLNLSFLAGALDPRITFTRASSGGRWDSTGRWVVEGNDVARFDYDPATPVGTVGAELVTNGDFSQGQTWWIFSQPTSGSVSVANEKLVIQSNDASYCGVSKTMLELGKTYTASITVDSVTGGGITFGMSSSYSGVITAPGTYSHTFKVTNTNFEVKRAATAVSAVIDNISVKEVTFAPRGLLIEEQRTNLLLHSRDMTQAAWSKTDVTPTRNQVGIDGTANSACLMTEGSAGSARTQQNGAAVTAGSVITSSIVVKRGNCDWIRLLAGETTLTSYGQAWFNLATGVKGAATAVGSATGVSSTITNLGGGWYRCTVTATPDGTYTVPIQWIQSAASDGVNTRVPNATYIVDAAQLEVGSLATTPVTTGAATATRAASVNSSTANIPGATGTVVFEAVAANWLPATSQTLLSLDDGTANNRLNLFRTNSGAIQATWVVGGVTQASIYSAGGVANGATFKVAVAWANGDCALSLNGATPVTGSGAIPSVTTRRIGMNYGSSNHWNSTIKGVREYPTRLSNATLQAMAA